MTMIHDSAEVHPDAIIGEGTSVWHLVQVRENAVIGENCTIGRAAYIGPGVMLGRNCKVQNLALIYDPAAIGDGVFIGPGAILTNDVYPRAVDQTGELKSADGWESVGVTIGDGASIGARAVIRAGVSIGAWALVGAGAVVVSDVPAHAMVLGNPARQRGWVGRAGKRLQPDGDELICPTTGVRHRLVDGELVEG
jgi:UDP-2-acetamido-3-amino-2,3-dideoxy-glucuronate N-acetyltransferase